jgi:hypothetical protein
VVIEGSNPAKKVHFKLPAGIKATAKQGVFELIGTEGLKIRNLDIDAGTKLDYCISVAGKVDGLLLENLTLRNARDANLIMKDAVATQDRPARLERMAFMVTQNNCDGIQFQSARATVSNVQVLNCRFAGKGYNAVYFVGGARSIELRNNRIYNFDYGLQFDGTNPCFVKVIHNTFHTMGYHAYYIPGENQSNPPSAIVSQLNYFAKSKFVIKAPSKGANSDKDLDNNGGFQSSDNARDKDSKGSNVNIKAETFEEKNYTMPAPENLEDDANFLRIDDKSPLKTGVGPNKVKVGAQ